MRRTDAVDVSPRSGPRARHESSNAHDAPPSARTIPPFSVGLADKTLLLAVVLAVAATIWRLMYGVSATDEAFYTALPWRFVMGGRPFIDEFDIHQTAGLLTYPLVWLWVHIVGSTTGIILFMRFAWFAFMGAVSVGAYRLMARLMPPLLAAASAASFVLVIPFAIPALSYNTLGSGLLTLGFAAIALEELAGATSVGRSITAGLLHALAVVAYPPLVVVVGVAAMCLALWTRRTRQWRRLVAYVSVAAGALLLFGALLLVFVGWDGLTTVYAYTQGTASFGGGIAKLQSLREQVRMYGAQCLLLQAVVLTLVLLGWKRAPWLRALMLVLPALSLFSITSHAYIRSLLWLTLGAVPLLILMFTLKRGDALRGVAVLIVPGALVGGAVTAWTSTNGVINAGLGLAPLLLVTFPLLLRATLTRADDVRWPVEAWSSVIAMTLLLGGLVVTAYSGSYGDAPPTTLRTRVTRGPWAGLYTVEGKTDIFESIDRDVQAVASRGETALIYYASPGAYLAAGLKPLSPGVWFSFNASLNDPRSFRSQMTRRYYARRGLPDVVIRLNLGAEGDSGSPLKKLTDDGNEYRLVLIRPEYSLYKRSR